MGEENTSLSLADRVDPEGTKAMVPIAKAFFVGEDSGSQSNALRDQDVQSGIFKQAGAIPPIYDPKLSLTQNRANIDDRRPIKDFLTISRWMHGLNSSCHALQVSVDKRYSRNITVGASYTWSKNLDYASSNGFGGSRGVNNPFNFFFSRGNSDYTRTHRFVNSFVWDVPRLKGNSKADAILGNWRLSSIITLMSGRPFSIGASNNSIAGAGSARAKT